VPREMDEGEFADLLLEQTQALLIDVAEIPRPLEGDEVEQRMEGYSDEIQGIALNVPPTADRHGHQQQARQRKRMSQGFGLPVRQQQNRSDTLATTRRGHRVCQQLYVCTAVRLMPSQYARLARSFNQVQELGSTHCCRSHRAPRPTSS
jgi:hypothetical protein